MDFFQKVLYVQLYCNNSGGGWRKNPVDICRLLLNRFNQHDGKSLGFFTAKKLYWLQRQDELKT